jgi:CRP-like cAMP-binding protein
MTAEMSMQVMARLEMFQGFNEKELKALTTVFKLRKVGAKGHLVREGEPYGSFFVVAHGEVRSYRTLSNGEEIILGTAGQGRLLGQKTLIDGKPQPVSLQAMSDTIVLECTRDGFLRLFQADSVITYRILDAVVTDLSHQIRMMTEAEEEWARRTGMNLDMVADILFKEEIPTSGKPVSSATKRELTEDDFKF